MAKLTLQMNLNNATFADERDLIIANILRSIADRVTSGETYDHNVIRDENESYIGAYSFSLKKP